MLERGEAMPLARSNEYAASIIHSMETGAPSVIYGNVRNTGLLPGLPDDCCVEVPCLVDATGVHPVAVPDYPAELAAMNRTFENPVELTVRAVLEERPELVRQAAMLDPNTAATLTLDEIDALCDELTLAHGDALPVSLRASRQASACRPSPPGGARRERDPSRRGHQDLPQRRQGRRPRQPRHRLGEFVVLVGPSGCGKSTLLRMIAGLEDVTVGDIYIGEMDVTDRPPQERDIAMVFQNYALYPHMTVRDNLAYGLKLRKMPKSEWRSRVDEVASVLGLSELLGRKPAALSGGQRQRVAMGRAIVRNPKAFLMDEPLSNLDAKLRVSMRAELAKLHERLGVTTVYVTHDQVEAMTLGQRVAVLRDGVLQQVDTPHVLFHAPANLFVAAFIGSPSMNLVEAEIVGDVVRFAGFDVDVARGLLHGRRESQRDPRHPSDRLRACRCGAATCRACASRSTSSRISAPRAI